MLWLASGLGLTAFVWLILENPFDLGQSDGCRVWPYFLSPYFFRGSLNGITFPFTGASLRAHGTFLCRTLTLIGRVSTFSNSTLRRSSCITSREIGSYLPIFGRFGTGVPTFTLTPRTQRWRWSSGSPSQYFCVMGL